MRKLILFALLMSCLPLAAQSGQWGTGATYFFAGFTGATGVGPDVYTTATSTSGTSWTNAGGTWTSPPANVNAPTSLFYQGKWYFSVAGSSDQGSSSYEYIGTSGANRSGTVTTIASIDFNVSPINCVVTYAGEWFVEDDGSVHRTTPCTSVSAETSGWGLYETHAVTTSGGSTSCSNANPCSSLPYWSAPAAVSMPSQWYYDQSVTKIGSKYVMWATSFCAATGGACGGSESGGNWKQGPVQMLSAGSLLGPYTAIGSGDWAGWESSVGYQEGPNIFPISGGWRLFFERLSTNAGASWANQMFYADCLHTDVTQCSTGGSWTTPAAWTQDMTYRHGTVRSLTLPPAGILGGA